MIERIQGGTVTGFRCRTGPLPVIEEVNDLYLDRKRVLHRCVPGFTNLALHYRSDSTAMQIGSVLAWRTADEIEISNEVIVTYPFAGNTSPRGLSARSEDGDDLTRPVGREPKLELTVNLRANPSHDPQPDDKIYRVLRAMSPQGKFFFFGRNLSEAYIIGESTQRSVRTLITEYGRQTVQPVLMEVE